MIFKHGEDGKIVYYERKGECRHCGSCCNLQCEAFEWVVLRDIKQGEKLETGVDKGMVRSRCNVYMSRENIGCSIEAREGYPTSPFGMVKNCGFYWIKVGEEDADA
jgi:hypothetical protein